jgi:uncharacterized membrane protein YhaH (DUF805 family)
MLVDPFMKITFAELWRSSGTIDRGPYALVGLIGFTLKHNLDRLVATYVFHRPWGLFNYWVPVRDVARITALHSGDARFLETMIVLALPFIWVGVALTTKRLRSANLPSPLVLLFFVPFLNLLFFLLLCLVPARTSATTELRTEWPKGSAFARIIPESVLGSAAISLLFTVPAGLAMVLIGVQLLTNYGWGFIRCFAVHNGIHGRPNLRTAPATESRRLRGGRVPVHGAFGLGAAGAGC